MDPFDGTRRPLGIREMRVYECLLKDFITTAGDLAARLRAIEIIAAMEATGVKSELERIEAYEPTPEELRACCGQPESDSHGLELIVDRDRQRW